MSIEKAEKMILVSSRSDNMHRLKLLIFCLLFTINIALPSTGLAETYYVATYGNDSHTKAQAQNPSTPWLTINHGVSQLVAGDTLLVRGGIYREQVTVGVSGTSGNRITIQAYPGEKPIIEGTKVIAGWTQCNQNDETLKDIDGVINPNYSNIYWAEIDASYIDDTKSVILFEDGNRLFIAQEPDQSNSALQNRFEYKLIQNEGNNYGQNSFIVDSANLTQSDDYWNGAFVRTYNAGTVRFDHEVIISDFDSATDKMTFGEALVWVFSSGDRYSIFNHPSILDKQGEYYHTTTPIGGKYKVYLWPNNVPDLTNKIGIPALRFGMYLSPGADFITIKGFEIQGFKAVIPSTEGGIMSLGCNGLIVENNRVHDIYGGFGIYFKGCSDSIGEDNNVYNIGPGSAIWVYGSSSTNITIKNNTIGNSESSSILIQNGVKDSKIIDNLVGLSPGAHNVGITIYGFSKNILVARNIAPYCRINQAENIVIFNNIFTGAGGSPIATWGLDMSGTVTIMNNILLSTNPGIYGNFDDLNQLIIKNNIVTSISTSAQSKSAGNDRTNNLFTNTLPFPTGTGSFIETDLTELFVDPANDDYRLRQGSPAINAGTDVTAYLPITDFPDFDFGVDLLGNPRDALPDISCYEYASGPPDITAPSKPQNLNATAISESQIALSWQESTDPESGINHYNIYRDGTLIATSVSSSYSDTALDPNTAYSYQVSAVNGAGLQSNKSNVAQATTLSDTTAPSVVSVNASESSVEIVFSEPMAPTSAEDINNYSISSGISVISASLSADLIRVTLATSAHTEGSYTLTVVNVQDIAGNPVSQTTIVYQYNEYLAGFWRFDETNGTTAQDSSGMNNTGTLINGPAWTTGKVGGGLSLDGADDYVDTGTFDVEGNGLTLIAWFKAESFISPYADNRLVSKATGTSEQSHYWMLSTINSGGVKLRFRLKTDGTTDTLIASSGDIGIGQWVHAAAVYDGSNMILYKDGVEVGRRSKTGTISTNNTVSVWIGRNPGNYGSFDGIIDGVRVYNRALSADEVLDLFNEAPSLVFDPIGDKQVDEGSNLTFEVITQDPNIVVDINDHNLPSEPNFFSNIFSWTPTYDDAGSYEVIFEAPHGEFVDSETITITVNETKTTKPIYRFYSELVKAHFYTMNAAEKDYIIATFPENVWRYEGIAWYAYAPGDQPPEASPVYRFYSELVKAHFYTMNAAEKDYIIATFPENVWRYEGIAWYAYAGGDQPPEASPVYRFYSELVKRHFYTISEAEKNAIIATFPEHVWRYEGIAYYAYPN